MSSTNSQSIATSRVPKTRNKNVSTNPYSSRFLGKLPSQYN